MNTVLVILPMRHDLDNRLKTTARRLLDGIQCSTSTKISYLIHDELVEPPSPAYPHRSKQARIRNKILDISHWQDFTHLLWIDADVVQYPANIIDLLLQTSDTGIAAPMVYIEKTSRFYDVAAFVVAGRDNINLSMKYVPGRNLQPEPPYWPKPPATKVVPMDCVGTVMLINTDVYKTGVRYGDSIFTEHHAICSACRKINREVLINTAISVYHANLPLYGEKWH